MKKSRIRHFKVEVEIPKGAAATEMTRMIEAAIKFFPGGLHPDDLMFDLNRESVKVTRIYKRKTQTY